MTTKMATGGVSVNKSDEIFDNVCSVCKEGNKTTEASKYCVDCHDYYCSDCVKIHITVPALKGHKVLDSKEVGPDEKLPMVPTSRCDKHVFKPLDMYCQSHDVVGCYTCMAVEHRTCQDVFYIPEFVKTSSNLVPEFLQHMTNIEAKFEEFLEKCVDEDISLQSNKQQEVEKIKEFSKKLEEKIKESEKEAIIEVNEKYKELNENLNKKSESARNEIQKIKSTRNEIDSMNQNESQAFVIMEGRKKEISASEKTCKDMKEIQLKRRIQFVKDSQNEMLMTRKCCLGKVKVLPYEFVHKGNINIKLSSDVRRCDIFGASVLVNGSIIFADKNNKNVKLIDSKSLTVADHYTLSSAPWELCNFECNEVAVCLPNEQKVQIFKVNGKLNPQRFIKLDFKCRGISYLDGHFYITDKTCLYMCNTDGDILKPIVTDNSGNSIFSNIYNVVVSKYNKTICVTDEEKGVISLDHGGNVLTVVSENITFAAGLTAADNGKFLACGYTSKNIICLDENGEFEHVVLKGLSEPQALCYNCNTGYMYVPNYDENTVQIYQLG